MKRRFRIWFNEWKCWFYFRHHMESIGKLGSAQLYQCSFCFKKIAANPFGSDKGIVKTDIPPQTAKSEPPRSYIGQPDAVQRSFERGRK